MTHLAVSSTEYIWGREGACGIDLWDLDEDQAAIHHMTDNSEEVNCEECLRKVK